MRYFYRKAHVRAAVRLYDLLGRLFRRSPASLPSDPPRHVCFVVLHQIGDAVISLTTIRAIMKAVPEAKFSLVTGIASAPIFKDCLPGAEIIEHDADWHPIVKMSKQHDETKGSAEHRLRLLLEELEPDAGIVFHPDLFANRALAKAGVPYRLGFGNGGGGFWLTECLDMANKGHQSERTFALAVEFCRFFGLEQPGFEAPDINPSDASTRSIERILAAATLSNAKIACLHPFGRFRTKDWNPAGWREVVDWLVGEGLTPLVVGGPKDDARRYFASAPSHTAMPPEGYIDLTGKLSLPETAALFAKASLFIGVDSGPAHIAAAVGCPVVSVFSVANSVEQWAPRGTCVITLTGPAPNVPGIGSQGKDLPKGHEVNPYTSNIAPSQVIKAAKALIDRPRTS